MGLIVCTEHEKLEGVPPVGGTPFCYADMDRAHMNRTKVLWPSGDQTGRVRRASVKVNSIAPPMVLKTSVVHADTCLDQSERGCPAEWTIQEPVSYTHLTLPTILRVWISVVAGALKEKKHKN